MKRLTLVVLLGLPSAASAYELLGSSWNTNQFAGGKVPYCPVVNASDATTTTKKNQFMAGLNAAAHAWADPATPCSALKVEDATGTSTCSGTPTPSTSKPFIFWAADWGSVPGVGPSTIGVTPWSSFGAEIAEAKILLNDRDFTWSTDGSQTDVQSITTHEFGHFIGLNHYDEYSSTKRNQCSGAVSPAVMCAFYPGGVVRTLSADDVQGVCYLYPKPGALGSACAAGPCGSGLSCHPTAGYCTKSCGTCPTGYTCNGTLDVCERDVPPPTCPACQDLPCGEGSMCMGSSGSTFCTNDCDAAHPCGAGFDCVALQDGGSVCWPFSNSCSDTGPTAGEVCAGDATCAFGNVCLDDGAVDHCYKLCNSAADCSGDDVCQELSDSLKACVPDQTCDQCGAMACGADAMCLSIGADSAFCAPDCTATTDCPVGFYCVSITGGGKACYPLSDSCESTGPGPGASCSDTTPCALGNLCLSSKCYASCRQNGDCGPGQVCQPTTLASVGFCEAGAESCDCDNNSGACDAGCTCDPDCGGGCSCDLTNGHCDAGCSACDPDCTPSCVCDSTNGCDAGCPCDGDCGCACDTSSACEGACACDGDCQAAQQCTCDATTVCDKDCPCDPECQCDCDVTTGCDAGCDSCDPECNDGCFNAAVRPDAEAPGNFAGIVVGLAWLWGRRRRATT